MSDLRSSELARAQVLIELGRWDDAVALLGAVVAADPSESRPHCLLAQALLGAGRTAEALEQAGEAAAADPYDEWPHRLRAIALLRLNDAHGAVAAAREAVRLAPELDSPYLVAVDAELRLGNTTAAAAAASKALELAPNRAGTHDALGRVALARRRNREAEGHFRHALRLEPEDPIALNNLGLALLRQGRRRSAVAYFASASKANPHDDLARRNAVRASLGAGGVGVAVLAAQAAVRTSGGSAVGWAVAGVAVLVTIAATGFRQRRLSRRHNDPLASKELMRTLRRSASFGERFFPRSRARVRRLSTPGLLLLFAVSVLLTIGAVGNLVQPDPADTASPVVYWLMLLLAVVCAGFAIVAVAARRGRGPVR
jgi:Flp pilus assembly protein TadD